MFKLFNLVVEYDDGLLIMDRFDHNKDGKVSISEVCDSFRYFSFMRNSFRNILISNKSC